MNIVRKIITNENNFEHGRNQWTGHPFIVLHTNNFKANANGDLYGNWQNNNPGTSAHFQVTHDGTIFQYVELDDTAYHAGNLWVNHQSVGIEHQDDGNETYTDKEYQATIDLIKWINEGWGQHKIAYDHNGIKKHSEVASTGCPGSLDVDRIINGCNKTAPKPTDPKIYSQKELDNKLKPLQDKIDSLNGTIVGLNTENENLANLRFKAEENQKVAEDTSKALQSKLEQLQIDFEAYKKSNPKSILQTILNFIFKK